MRRVRLVIGTLAVILAPFVTTPTGHAITTTCVPGELSSVTNVRGGPHYNVGAPTLTDLWVSPTGNDDNAGTLRSAPLATLAKAWSLIPAQTTTTGYRIRLMAGTYTGQSPFLDDKRGSRNFPIIIQSEAGGATGRNTTIFDGSIDVAFSAYVYILDLTIRPTNDSDDTIHLQHGDHFLLRNLTVRGFDAREAVKVNQATHVFVEDSDLAHASDNSLDFVAVQCGHIVANDLHDAGDWCGYVKGGAAYLRVEGNRFYDCDGGGFSAGQGTGFQYMVPAQLHYEAYDVKVINNVVHDVAKAAFGAQGAYDVLIAFNTAFRAGQGYDQILSAEPGERTCDPDDRAMCNANRSAGGWGPTSAYSPEYKVHIPNKHVFIYNNLLWNDQVPAGQHLRVPGPFTNAVGFGAPTTVRSDDDLRIAGNIIANGGPGHPYATDGGCLPGHPTCGPSVFASSNRVNVFTPQLVDPVRGDFRPTPGGNVATAPVAAIPNFTWADAPTSPPVPQGNLSNAVPRNFLGQARSTPTHPGAF
jgi:hypothetical protein